MYKQSQAMKLDNLKRFITYKLTNNWNSETVSILVNFINSIFIPK